MTAMASALLLLPTSSSCPSSILDEGSRFQGPKLMVDYRNFQRPGVRSWKCHCVRSMAPDEEKMTKRSPLDFPIEWERPSPSRRADIFPQFSPMKAPLPPPLPADPPEEEEEDEEEKEEEEEQGDKPPEKEPEKPEE